MKKCSTCKRKLPFDAFPKNKSKHDGLASSCKKCKKSQQHNWYVKNKDDHYSKIKARQLDLKRKKWEYLLDHPCVDCGKNDPRVLEFDHISDKTMNVSAMIINGNSWMKILEEIAKCEVCCANCHKIRTHTRGQFYGELA